MIDKIRQQISTIRQRQEVQHAFQRVFSTNDGKLIMDHLIKSFCIHSTFEDNAAKSAWREGRRAMILQIATIAFGPDQFADTLREALAQQQTEEE